MRQLAIYFYLSVFLFLFLACKGQPASKYEEQLLIQVEPEAEIPISGKTIHVLVALCDNKYQGIVPVPPAIGNGQDPHNNLYWGCGYGVRTYFKKSSDWQLLKTIKDDGIVLERLVFKHKHKDYYLVADAYDGKYIKQCTKDFLHSLSGEFKDTLSIDSKVIGVYGRAKLIAYIGHDGLMDFSLAESFKNVDGEERDCIILACKSKQYFTEYAKNAGANPLVWTTNLMAPEAYTLHDALTGYVAGEDNEQIRTRAAQAYAKYQKCGEKGARNLLVSGF